MSPLWIFIPAVFVLAALAFYVKYKREKARTEAVRRVARMRGFEFREQDAGVSPQTHLFSLGRARKSWNVLSREDSGEKVVLFDYRYTTSGGKSSHLHYQTVAAFRRDGRTLPVFNLRPENVLHKIASAMGWKDIDFDSRPEFSGAYLLQGPEEAAVRRAFGTNVLAFFEQHRGWSVESEGPWLIVYRANSRPKPEELEKFLGEAKEVAEVFGSADSRFP